MVERSGKSSAVIVPPDDPARHYGANLCPVKQLRASVRAVTGRRSRHGQTQACRGAIV